MKETQYKSFSLRAHKKNWQIKRPNVCQFELTFGCGLHCRHCYSDCYNKPAYLNKQMTTTQIKFILDKIHHAGVIWVCFTGGDPLVREDFLELYSYAKDKGFIISIFTNGYSMTEETADYLKNRPPFAIEITLNAVNKKAYEDISQVKGSYEKAMYGLRMIIKRKLPLKIKTQIMKDNLKQFPQIKRFIEGLGLEFRPSSDLYSRLNGDLSPCSLRITPEEVLGLTQSLGIIDSMDEQERILPKPSRHNQSGNFLFRCAAGSGDGINIDPFGNIFLCNLIRQPRFNLLKVSIEEAVSRLSLLVRGRKFTTDSKCKYCSIWELCHSCPGKALLEAGDMQAPVEYYCKLAKATAAQMGQQIHKRQAG